MSRTYRKVLKSDHTIKRDKVDYKCRCSYCMNGINRYKQIGQDLLEDGLEEVKHSFFEVPHFDKRTINRITLPASAFLSWDEYLSTVVDSKPRSWHTVKAMKKLSMLR